MGEDVRRTQRASKAKIQQSGKGHVVNNDGGNASGARNSPLGRRLAALRKKKAEK